MYLFPIVLNTEPRLVGKFWARSPISLKHMMAFQSLFLDPHLTTPLKYRYLINYFGIQV